jgi:microcin C transport system permease protein
MTAYIIRRLLLMIPILFGVLLVAFAVGEFAPGGPVERVLAQLRDSGTKHRGAQGLDPAFIKRLENAQGLDPAFIKKLEKQFGFDKPAYVRFFIFVKSHVMLGSMS